MKNTRCLRPLTLILSVLLAGNLHAELLVLNADRMFDATRGEMIEPATIVIRDNLVESVNPENIPENARVINFGDSTLLPGLIDMHSHVTMDYFTDDFWVTAFVNETAADWSVRGAKFARLTLDAGFTTVRDLGAWPGFPDVALMRAINRGDVPGPDVWPAGHAISITGGHCDVTGFAPGIMEMGPKQGIADGVDEVIKAVRYQAKHGVRVIKVCATGGVLSFSQNAEIGALQYSLEELEAIVREARKLGLKVAAHAHGTEGINTAILAGVSSIEHGSILSDESIDLMIENGTYLVPQAYINEMDMPPETPASVVEKNEYLKPLVIQSIQKAYAAGVNIALGTDSGVFAHGENGAEFAALVGYGIEPAYALQMATVFAADLLGVDDRGVIAAGKRADIVAVSGDPLTNIRTMENVVFVIKDGEIFKNNN
ncbi:MAG TPA: amidohydrolase family protein [Xanthomonadales bacterium]|nr:amidohydrolase family protein [Xanthomonadales bacterium]